MIPKFKREELLKHIDEFYELYMNRPIKENGGGMKSAHMFPSWFIIKTMMPEFIIESGVWKGLGTWIFEKASPNSKIISIDPNPQYKEYVSENVVYQTTDFLKTNWDFLNKNNVLLFLDDHQNSIERIRYANSIGIKKIIVEDNYPYCQGDCYSPKKVMSKRKYVIDSKGIRNWFENNEDDYEFLTGNINYYQEFPPLFKDQITRWGDEWDCEKYPTEKQLLGEELKDKYQIFFNERKDYTWICYLELN